jgi:hypothetical protein
MSDDILDSMRDITPPMPRSRLMSITATIAAISDWSDGKATIPELTEALTTCFDCNTMIYVGRGYGLAEAIDGSLFNEYSGYFERKAILTGLFNVRYWDHPDATVQQSSVNDFLVLKHDGVILAQRLWEMFFSESLSMTEIETRIANNATVRVNTTATDGIGQDEAAIDADIDPADLPDELHAANIAFRAVTNGHGDKSATFKNRLIDYLEKNFPGLNNEAVQRIATVANPDKAPGRKKRNVE